MSDVRLIDANRLEEAFAKECTAECPICSYYKSDAEVDVECHCGLINNAPTVEERPIGEWIFDAEHSFTIDLFKCSVCGSGGHTHFNFCPNCGAKMKGEKE